VLLVADLDIRILTEDGEILRQLTLDPTRDYQRQQPPQRGTMSRDICARCRATSQGVGERSRTSTPVCLLQQVGDPTEA